MPAKDHILVTRWTRLARDIQNSFSRIEKTNPWLSGLINGSIAGAAVAIIAWLVSRSSEGDFLIFACLGSSAASVVFAPLARSNSLRSIVVAYLVSSGTCIFIFWLRQWGLLPLTMQCFLAVAIPVALMRITDAMHPAAIGNALAFLIYARDIRSLSLLLAAVLTLLTIVKILVYIYRKDLELRNFVREFTFEFYGLETVVTVTNDAQRELEEPPIS